MIKRIKSRRERRRFGSGESSPGAGYHSRRLFAKARRRRRSLRVLVVLLVSLAGALLAVGYASSGTAGVGDYLSAISGSEYSTAVWEEEPAGSVGAAPEPVPEQADTSPEAVAYRAVATEIPGMDAETVRGVYQSKLDPSWASVQVEGPEDEGTYVLFLQRDGDSWTTRGLSEPTS